jgi:hypothetical protein
MQISIESIKGVRKRGLFVNLQGHLRWLYQSGIYFEIIAQNYCRLKGVNKNSITIGQPQTGILRIIMTCSPKGSKRIR